MSFHDQLVAIRDRKHSQDHPFFDLWAQGKLTKEQTAVYCAQHYHYVTDYLDWMTYEASQIRLRDVKAYLYENLGDEENPEDRHLDMLKDYVAATGSSRDSVEAATIRRWRYMNGIYWFALHGKEDDTPSLEVQSAPAVLQKQETV